jgi:hypothetical protein
MVPLAEFAAHKLERIGMTSQISKSRLIQQALAASTFQDPADVVRWLGAVQAQDYAAVKWALGLRIPGSTAAGVQAALEQCKILRTWALRGTLHFVLPDDAGWILDLVANRTITRSRGRHQQLGLDEITLSRSNDLLGKALQGGKQLRRSELIARLNQNGISTQGQRAPHILARASLDRIIIQSAAVRNDPVYHLFDEVVPAGQRLTRKEAAAELARRFFKSHGPATLQDFIWWSGLLVSEARAALEEVKNESLLEWGDGKSFWITPSGGAPAAIDSPTVVLLPPFDELIIGYKDRSAALDPAQALQIKLANGLSPTIALDGKIIGTWKRKVMPSRMDVAVNIAAGTELIPGALDAAVQRYSQFLAKPVHLLK